MRPVEGERTGSGIQPRLSETATARPDWTWYLSKFWGRVVGIASGIAVLAKWKTILDWIGLKVGKGSENNNRNDGTDEV